MTDNQCLAFILVPILIVSCAILFTSIYQASQDDDLAKSRCEEHGMAATDTVTRVGKSSVTGHLCVRADGALFVVP